MKAVHFGILMKTLSVFTARLRKCSRVCIAPCNLQPLQMYLMSFTGQVKIAFSILLEMLQANDSALFAYLSQFTLKAKASITLKPAEDFLTPTAHLMQVKQAAAKGL